MNLSDGVGIKCERIAKGMQPSERTVYIRGMPYIVNCRNIIFNRQSETHYVKIVRIQESNGRLMAGINANRGYECFVVDEENLVTRR